MHTITDVLRLAADLASDGRWDEADDVTRRLLEAIPGEPLTAYMHAQSLLARGDYAAAWPLFQRRIDTEFYRNKGSTRLPRPYWDGTPVPGRTILIHMDEGLGDLVMCARFVPLAADRAGRVILAVPEGTRAVFATVDPRIDIIEIGEPIPAFDLHLHAFSLPAVFHAAPGTIPPPECLRPDPALAADIRRRLGDGYKVGLVWHGNPRHPRDAARSIPLAAFEPILRVPGVRFLSLQVGHGREQLAELPEDIRVEDAADPRLDHALATMACLDLLITVDSAPVHLAGALGVVAWLALPLSPDWRWLREGAVSPWYPRTTLFRQTRAGDWSGCMAAMAQALVTAASPAIPRRPEG